MAKVIAQGLTVTDMENGYLCLNGAVLVNEEWQTIAYDKVPAVFLTTLFDAARKVGAIQ